MKFFKNSIRNFSINITQSAPASIQTTPRINSNFNRKSSRQFLKLKTNYTDDFIGLTNVLGNNFNIKNTSQIYNNSVESTYLGYIELESNLNETVFKNLMENIFEEYGIENTSASFEIVGAFPDRNLSKENKRVSLLNKKNVSSIVSAKLYHKTSVNNDGDLFNLNQHRNQDYGVILDRLEANKEYFDVIELQSEPDLTNVVHNFDEFAIIKHFIERIRDRNILSDKLISVRTKKSSVAARSIQEGVDIINDPTGGTADPILLDMISKSKVFYILSSHAGQENFSKFSLMNNFSQMTPFEYYINTIDKKLQLCQEKGIPNWNIAIDLDINKFGRKLAVDIYDKLSLLKNKYENTLMSSFNVDPVIKSILGGENNNENELIGGKKQIIEYLLGNGINMIRFDNWDNFESYGEHVKNFDKLGEVLHTGLRIRSSENIVETLKVEVEEIPDKVEVKFDIQKEDDLTVLIKKLESGKI